MSIYKDLLFLHGYLRDPSLVDDIEPARSGAVSGETPPDHERNAGTADKASDRDRGTALCGPAMTHCT